MDKPRRQLFKDKEHLVRMAGIFAAVAAMFFILQMMLVPKSFGLYGHYRADALKEERARPLTYAGRAQCARCHAPQVETQQSGKHASLGCEACHGALARHSADPKGVKAVRPDPKRLCATCHEKNAARPKWFKQVDTVEHSSGEACNSCHQPHAPQM